MKADVECLLCSAVRAEKEQMQKRIDEGQQQEEVDDSGFFAGETGVTLLKKKKKSVAVHNSPVSSFQVVQSLG